MLSMLILELVCAPFEKPPGMPKDIKYGPTDQIEMTCVVCELMVLASGYRTITSSHQRHNL